MAKSAILKIDILSDFNGRGFAQAESDLSKLGGAVTKTAALLGVGFVAGGVAAVKAASSLSESMNAVGKVFGDSAGTITAFGQTAAEQVGLSQRAFQELATSTGALLGNMGYSTEQAADSTVTLAQRAADMASVFNTDVATALEAINSGLRGETEPLRAFGVSLSDAAVKAQAMEMGLYDGKGAIDAHAKALATEALILEQTSSLAGDFAATSDGAANSQRTLTAQVEDLAAQLGTALMPTVEAVIGGLRDFATWAGNNQGVVKGLIAVLATMTAVTLGVAAAMKVANAVMLIWRGVMAAFKVAQLVYITLGYLMGTATLAATWPILAIVVAIAAVIAIIVLLVKNWDKVLDVMKAVIGWIKNTAISAWGALSDAVAKVVDWLKKVWDWVKKIWEKSPIGKIAGIIGGRVSVSSAGALTASTVAAAPTARAAVAPTVVIQAGIGDPHEIARQVRRVLRDDAARLGTSWQAAW